ncbi:hypothetical protein INR49_010830 [Caranx melampygus]|nr:hypothetical protein INR49_010830 [Caranx melampygus]
MMTGLLNELNLCLPFYLTNPPPLGIVWVCTDSLVSLLLNLLRRESTHTYSLCFLRSLMSSWIFLHGLRFKCLLLIHKSVYSWSLPTLKMPIMHLFNFFFKKVQYLNFRDFTIL